MGPGPRIGASSRLPGRCPTHSSSYRQVLNGGNRPPRGFKQRHNRPPSASCRSLVPQRWRQRADARHGAARDTPVHTVRASPGVLRERGSMRSASIWPFAGRTGGRKEARARQCLATRRRLRHHHVGRKRFAVRQNNAVARPPAVAISATAWCSLIIVPAVHAACSKAVTSLRLST